MTDQRVMLITGTRKGIGRYLAEYYTDRGWHVFGCSRRPTDLERATYTHVSLDVADEAAVKRMFFGVRKLHGRLDALINNAGIASMNHVLLTPIETVESILRTNVVGTFLFCREAAKLMRKRRFGRIVNLTSVAAPLRLAGEAAYASSKEAVVMLTRIFAKELAEFGVTVNAVGPTPVKTDLIRSVSEEKLQRLLEQQAIRRYGEFSDVSNVIDFFLLSDSDFVTGQTIYLGGVG